MGGGRGFGLAKGCWGGWMEEEEERVGGGEGMGGEMVGRWWGDGGEMVGRWCEGLLWELG